MNSLKGILFGLLLLSAQAFAEQRFTTSFQTDYNGKHPDLFAQQQERVRLLVNQAQMDVTSRLGLFQYREGFRCPLIVRFDDAPMPGVEHALAYVAFLGGNQCGQMMVINLDVMAQYPGNFDPIFYHEMTHAVLNDAIVFETKRPLPAWVQEGLATYIGGEGEERVRTLAQQVRKYQAKMLLSDLQDDRVDYPGNYLAFKYLFDKHSINAIQGFIHYLMEGKTPMQSIFEATGLKEEEFRNKVRDYSLAIYREQARPDF